MFTIWISLQTCVVCKHNHTQVNRTKFDHTQTRYVQVTNIQKKNSHNNVHTVYSRYYRKKMCYFLFFTFAKSYTFLQKKVTNVQDLKVVFLVASYDNYFASWKLYKIWTYFNPKQMKT